MAVISMRMNGVSLAVQPKVMPPMPTLREIWTIENSTTLSTEVKDAKVKALRAVRKAYIERHRSYALRNLTIWSRSEFLELSRTGFHHGSASRLKTKKRLQGAK
jgi:hypothetical protein